MRADIKVGFNCNNNCSFCVQGHKKEFGNKTTKEVKKMIQDAKDSGCDSIVLTGGEPTIREDIIEIVRFANTLKFDIIQIQSNARMFYYLDFCKKMVATGANEFSPALHGHIPELHDYLVGSEGAFMQCVKGIRNLKSLGQTVITNTVITKSNYIHLPQIAQLFANLHVDQCQFAFVHALGAAEKNFWSVVPRKELVVPYIKKAIDIAVQNNMFVMAEAIPPCFMQGYEQYISEQYIPDGKVYDLDLVVEDYEEVRRNEGKCKGPNCKECKYFKTCEGPWKEYPNAFGWGEFVPVLEGIERCENFEIEEVKSENSKVKSIEK